MRIILKLELAEKALIEILIRMWIAVVEAVMNFRVCYNWGIWRTFADLSNVRKYCSVSASVICNPRYMSLALTVLPLLASTR
jgi:hypothetical protein